MKILSVDSSAKTASVAVTDDEKLLSECFVNAGLTHSRTLMPMIDNALSQADMTIKDIDAFCVTCGPGSFTGIRIGISAVKGLALANEKPCAGVSTLHAAAYNFADEKCIVCAVMDARCNQVYTALFRCDNSAVTRLCEDKAISINDLFAELSGYSETVYLVGDGAQLCFEEFGEKLANVRLANESRRFQRAFGAAMAALSNASDFKNSALLAPVYLRLPQAERELKIRKGEKI